MTNSDPAMSDRERAVGTAVIPIAQITLLVDMIGQVIEYETNRYPRSEVATELSRARDVLVKAFQLAESRFQQL